MLSHLVVISGPDQGRTFSLAEGQSLLIGRGESAKAMSGTLARQITKPGELVGDVLYMSPERTRSQADVDTRSDLYSLGATAYALLTGHAPFEGQSLPDVIGKIRQAEPVSPRKYQPSIPDVFEWTVLRMLNKDPADRQQTPAELLDDLGRVAKYAAILM